ncbi:NADH-quinone oxidoreductase subunit N [Pseudonocardia ammonioxydans]|uniref:NADH-quinone oxidoreductase subunit N n=2 Tax=Pseudonocardia ammonioxydans TaxID=260086 RepID=A0A1I5IGR8_PSUAM|nr:NADH-quinone oxidoreductase subunit N [Pseudonocardia ammonioxydans]SFO59868.1 NADH-quinone oxidoreductase subunit N [Pseudonocardia ammonioxydans]
MDMTINSDPSALIPEIALLLGAVTGLLLGAWTPRRRQWTIRVLAALACTVGLAATAVAATRPVDVVFGTYVLDTATHATRAIVLVATLLLLALCGDTVAGHRRETEFVVLVQLGALGSMLLGGAADLILLFAAFLLASVPLYALAGWAKQGTAPEAALKYYLAGALAGVTTVAGVTLLFGTAGATGYDAVADGIASGPGGAAAVGLIAVLVGLAFKAGAVPAHFWVPDVADGTPPAVAAVITTLPKIGALVATYRLLDTAVPADVVDWPLIVAILAAVSMTLGNLAAFAQTSVLRLLGYSTISQVGYLLMALAVAGRASLAQPALLFYLAAYAITNIAAFAVVAATGQRTLAGHRGLFHRDPPLAIALVVALLGLVGTPPTAVFLGKLVVFTATVDGGLVWLVALAVVNTVASLFYYLRWIAPAFGEPGPDHERPVTRARGWARGTALGAAALSLLLGLGGGVVLNTVG